MPVDQRLLFVLGGDLRFTGATTGRSAQDVRIALLGASTRSGWALHGTGRLRMFVVSFQPGALHWLSGLDAATLTNGVTDATTVFGGAIGVVADRLNRVTDMRSRVAIVECWLRAVMGQIGAPPADAVTAAATRLRCDDGRPCDLATLVRQSGYSTSQFRRRFVRQIGLPPKRYARWCRLASVLELVEGAPDQSWAERAQATGFFDQAHLAHDFRQLVGTTPGQFLRQQRLQPA